MITKLKIENRLNKENKLEDDDKEAKANDRIINLKEKVNDLLLDEDTKKDVNFRNYLMYLNNQLNNMNLKVCNLNEEFIEKYEKHERYINKLNTSLNSNEYKILKNNYENKKTEKELDIKTNSNKNKDVRKNNTTEQFEFKIGSNVLNILGVIMILIALVTFGKYIYTNYMTDILKGIFLFGISSSILALGECVFRKKVPKFAVGISALGVGSLYASVIVNFLVLETISYIWAIILTLTISGISLWISLKNNCKIIRTIGLLGAYICFMPSDYLNIVQSYITVVILSIVSLANIYIPIKDKKLSMYLSVANILFSMIIVSIGFLHVNAIILYLTLTVLFNSMMYIKLNKDEDGKYNIWCLATTMSLIILPFDIIKANINFELICVGVFIISYYLSSDKLKNIFYCNFLVALILPLMSLYDSMYKDMYTVIYASLVALTLYIMNKRHDTSISFVISILKTFGIFDFLLVQSIVSFIIYIMIFSILIWTFGDKYKNETLVIVFKYSFLLSLIYNVIFNEINFNTVATVNYNLIIASIIAIIYVLISTNVERVKDEYFKTGNKIILISTIIIINIFGMNNFINSLIFIAISIMTMSIFMNDKYVDKEFIHEYDLLVYSLYLTYGICILYFESPINYEINNIILSISLMMFAFINVWIGFKLDKVEIRKYGLMLSLLVCAKLILIDFYSYEFIIKTALFLFVGILSLIISYIYSKLEQELKNKQSIESVETNNEVIEESKE